MAGLQRSAVSFRRQGSSGLVWDDRFVSGELNRANNNNKDRTDDGGGVLLNKPELDPDLINKEPTLDLPRARGDRPPPRPPQIETAALERSRSTEGGARYRTGRVSPAIEPPSPKVSACGLCAPFGKQPVRRAMKKAKHGNNRRSR